MTFPSREPALSFPSNLELSGLFRVVRSELPVMHWKEMETPGLRGDPWRSRNASVPSPVASHWRSVEIK